MVPAVVVAPVVVAAVVVAAVVVVVVVVIPILFPVVSYSGHYVAVRVRTLRQLP